MKMIVVDKEKYVNQTVRATSLTIRFDPTLAVHGKLGDVQACLRRHDRGQLARAEENSGFLYMFRRDADETVAVGVDRIAFVSLNYPGFGEFLRTASVLIEELMAILQIPAPFVVQFQYENFIELPFSADAETVPAWSKLSDWLDLPVWSAATRGATQVDTIDCAMQSRTSNGTLNVGLTHLGETTDLRNRVWKLDIMSTISQAMVISDAATSAHAVARQTFESIITERFREHLRGRRA